MVINSISFIQLKFAQKKFENSGQSSLYAIGLLFRIFDRSAVITHDIR